MKDHNLLVLSDVHLGSDLVQHARPEAPTRGEPSERRDRDLVAMLDWYRAHRLGDRPWKLVLAGDFVDFVGMSVATSGKLETQPTDEERAHGLGGAVDHAIAKLELVGAHHSAVFHSLSHFLAEGNTLVVLRGNHDLDLHWEPVQKEFIRQLEMHAPVTRGHIEFAPWFYYEEGVIYVEHGHQYDRCCSYDHLLHPVSPRDPRRSTQSLSDILLRYVVRPTRGMLESGHDRAGLVDYLRFAKRLGTGGMLALLRRFLAANGALFGAWREHFSSSAAWVRREHERKMTLLAEAKQISLDRLKALAKLQRPPVTRSVTLILASMMLDRIVIGVAATAAFATIIISSPGLIHIMGRSALAALGLAGITAIWARSRRALLDASAELRLRAASVAKLFPAAFVVMGHTHLPEVHLVPSEQVTYVNLGSWAEESSEDGSPGSLPATRTHLVVQYTDSGLPVAELLKWNASSGPERFDTGFDARSSPFGGES
ncbi:MAG TPA: metallophosphoesterase [Polyangiaceae bacterium]